MKQIFRMIMTAILLFGALEMAKAQTFAPDLGRNYVLTRTPRVEVTDPNGLSSLECLQSLEYLDEWGRPQQSIQLGITPHLKSLATYQEYDFKGNPSRHWIPVLGGDRAVFLPLDTLKERSREFYDGDTWGYSLSEYDCSPLNRLKGQYKPGQEAVGKPAGHQYEYDVLNSSTSVRRYVATSGSNDTIVNIRLAGMYGIADLQVLRDYNEDNQPTTTYTDKLGRVVLKQSPLHYEVYYVYDDKSRLCAVLSPELSDSLTTVGDTWSNASSNLIRQYAYLYTYDGEGRCSHKRLPGTAWTYYYYDQTGQLILTQDGNMRKNGECMFTIPDVYGRIVLEGICKNTCSLSINPLQDAVVRATRSNQTDVFKGYHVNGIIFSFPTIEIVNYYDDYGFMGKNDVPSYSGSVLSSEQIVAYGACRSGNPTGFQTGKLLRLTDNSYTYQAMYYDERGRMIQHHLTNNLGGADRMWYAHDFSGDVVKSKHVHTAMGKASQVEYYTYSYDHAGRLTDVFHQLNDGERVRLIANDYDDLGRVAIRKVHDSAFSALSYTYNVRDWLLNINGSAFTERLEYTGGPYPKYNGDVTVAYYQYGLTETGCLYFLEYDQSDRLIKAEHWDEPNRISIPVEQIGYDRNGNILHLQRTEQTITHSHGLIDDLTYTYDGNQLKAVDDASETSASNGFEFKDGAKTAVEYSYDVNGNLIKDLNKNITDIQYNFLNLPTRIQFGAGDSISYLYDADGVKLRTTYVIDGVTSVTDYCSNAIYENGTATRLLTEAGYISLNDQVYHYYLQDHQGNNCVVIDQTGEIEETTRYYPFGGIMNSTSNVQPYKYNGKELDIKGGLNLYDYGARYYDPAIGRWHTADPLSEKYYQEGAYVYCGNNPVNRIDPFGMDYWSTSDPDEISRFMDALRFNNNSISENFDFNSWNHATDSEFTGNLTFNDETNAFYSSYGTVEDGVPTRVGVSIKASNVWEGGASIDGGRGRWYRKASGRLENTYPEFELFTFVRGLLNLTVKGGSETGVQIGRKLEYVFGKATGNSHNIERSKGMLKQLQSIGIFDAPTGRAYLEDHLRNVYKIPGILQDNGRFMRESLLMGPNGGLKVQSIWENNRLITVELFGGK